MTVWWRETWRSTAVDLTVENQPTNNQHPALSSITSTGGPPFSENHDLVNVVVIDLIIKCELHNSIVKDDEVKEI